MLKAEYVLKSELWLVFHLCDAWQISVIQRSLTHIFILRFTIWSAEQWLCSDGVVEFVIIDWLYFIYLYFKCILNIGYLDINMHSRSASLLLPHQPWHPCLKASKWSVAVVYIKTWFKLFSSKQWSYAEAAASFILALQSKETAVTVG